MKECPNENCRQANIIGGVTDKIKSPYVQINHFQSHIDDKNTKNKFVGALERRGNDTWFNSTFS